MDLIHVARSLEAAEAGRMNSRRYENYFLMSLACHFDIKGIACSGGTASLSFLNHALTSTELNK
jgi:hypothetical protein